MTLEELLELPLHERVRAIRKQTGTLDQFAELVGAHGRGTVIRWEKPPGAKGGAKPSERYAVRLAEVAAGVVGEPVPTLAFHEPDLDQLDAILAEVIDIRTALENGDGQPASAEIQRLIVARLESLAGTVGEILATQQTTIRQLAEIESRLPDAQAAPAPEGKHTRSQGST